MSDTASFGYGQQGPNDTADDHNSIMFMVRQLVARLDTMKLVQVTAVTGGAGAVAPAGTVTVLPLVNQIDGGGFATPHGTIAGIPWSRVQGGKNAVIVDPEVGDIGWVVAADRDISNVKSTKKQANPGSYRKFDISDGVYAGACLNVAPDQYLVFTATGVRLVDKNGNSVAMAAGGITITSASGQPITLSGAVVTSSSMSVATTLEVTETAQIGTTLQVGTSIEIGGGATIDRVLAGTVTTNFGGSVAGTGTVSTTISVTGAHVGDVVVLGMTAPGLLQGIFVAYVSASDTVTVQISNPFTGSQVITSQTYTVLVFGHA